VRKGAGKRRKRRGGKGRERREGTYF